MKFNLPQDAQSGPSGVNRLVVTIVGTTGPTVMIRDPYGTLTEIDGSIRPKGVGLPAAGERWIVARVSDRWEFQTMLNAPQPVTVTGTTTDEVLMGVLDALSAAGLIVDSTTRPAPPVLDDTTDPSVADGAAAVREDLGYEATTLGVTPVGPPISPGSRNDYGYRVSAEVPGVGLVSSVQFDPTLGPDRFAADLRRLTGQSDLVLMRGVTRAEKTAALAAELPSGWHQYRHATMNTQVAWWDPEIFSGVGDVQPIGAADGAGLPQRTAMILSLTHLPTRVDFTVINLSLENGAAYPGIPTPHRTSTAPDHISRLATQIAAVRALLSTITTPVLVVGGFEVSDLDDDRHGAPNMPRAFFASSGLASIWDIDPPNAGTRTTEEAALDGAFWRSPIRHQMSIEQPRVLYGYHSEGRPVTLRARFSDFR